VLRAKSVHDLNPIETGGTVARQGFGVQDHIAAGFLIDMIVDSSLEEVWCENQDDITLIWRIGPDQLAEFVQVKSNELDGLWSVAEFCKRDSGTAEENGRKRSIKKEGTSILEKSLAYDRCAESCSFRIVTCWQVNGDLKILTYHLESEYRTGAAEEIEALKSKLTSYVGSFRSENANDCGFWADRAHWHVVGPLEDIKNRNLLTFAKALSGLGYYILNDQLEELYPKLVAMAWEAGRADWRKLGKDAKKIKRATLVEWLTKALQSIITPSSSGGHKTRQKMELAQLPADSIDAALEERTLYLTDRLTPQYSAAIDYRRVEGEVVSALHTLRSHLDAGVYDDNGLKFHARCRDRLNDLMQNIPPERRPSQSFVHGCMYNITDRCAHRFLRASA
jgi:Cap4 dsDNA endonuclease